MACSQLVASGPRGFVGQRHTALPLLRCRKGPRRAAGGALLAKPTCYAGPLNWARGVGSKKASLVEGEQRAVRTAESNTSGEAFGLLDVEAYVEFSRQHVRTTFTVDDWVKHRSPWRYWQHLAGLPRSSLLLGMAPVLLYVVGVATAVCAYQSAFQAGLLHALLPDLHITSKELGQLFGLTSFALSLLLVFRTNASYERWDGARKMWGLVLNRSRDVVRQGLAWIPAERAGLRDMLCRWVPAFSKALMCHLRKGEDLSKELEGILLPHEVKAVLQASHRPNYILQVLAQIVRAACLPTAITMAMEQNLTNFEDCLGGCERILRTPVPVAYARHTSRFMMMWLTALPFTLVASLGWGAVPACGVIAYLLLGIKEITVSIEEPFSILPLETISGTVVTNVRELQAMHSTAQHGMAQHSAASGGTREVLSAAALVALAEREEAKQGSRRLKKDDPSHRGVGEERTALPALVAA